MLEKAILGCGYVLYRRNARVHRNNVFTGGLVGTGNYCRRYTCGCYILHNPAFSPKSSKMVAEGGI